MVRLVLGIHNHQPVGNFDHVFEKAHQLAYGPFLNALERHPHVKVSLHCTGPLWEWLEARRPEYLERVEALARSGRVELMGGAFYEAVLAAVPEKDQQGQLDRMAGFLRGRFGVRPRGAWLAERVWEPHLPKVLARAGVEYTVLDDAHFKAAGFQDRDLEGYFLTEMEGEVVRVFPISQRLRYEMPYGDPRGVVEGLARLGGEDGGRSRVLVMADDGEKFGLWPGTHKAVYEDGWLDRFFAELGRRRQEVVTSTFSEVLDHQPPRGWAYLPTGSYSELSEWALGPESGEDLARALQMLPPDLKPFARGGYFRNFLTKYPEAGRLYRKMLRVSRKVHRLPAGEARETALGHLWRAQCNCAYWHGVFGGLYLPHLRAAVYEHLLKAEREADRGEGSRRRAGRVLSKGAFWVEREDWDGDGRPELLVESERAGWYFSPAKGAGLWEWDLKEKGVNLQALVGRRKESYHAKLKDASPPGVIREARSIHGLLLAKEPDLEKKLFYDWHPRTSLLDHFLHPETKLEGFKRAQYGEQGDFVLSPYGCEHPALEEGRLRLRFSREGTVWAGERRIQVRVSRTVRLDPEGGWACEVEVVPEEEAELWYGLELAWAFLSPEAFGEEGEARVAEKVFSDRPRGFSVALRADPPTDLWTFPVETIAQSEEGFERTYQGSVLLLHRRGRHGPGRPLTLRIQARPVEASLV